MKKINKKIFIFALTIVMLSFFITPSALAISNPFDPSTGEPPVLQVNFGDTKINFDSVVCTKGVNCSIGWISQYVGALYNYGVGLAVILSIVMIMVGGFIWLLSAGSPDKITTAKSFIGSSLTGLALALFSFIILASVNPRLVSFDKLNIASPQEIEGSGDGVYYTSNGGPVEIGLATTGSNLPPKNPSAMSQTASYLDQYNSDGLSRINSFTRSDGTRHDPNNTTGDYHGNVVDFRYNSNGELTQHIETNGRLLTGSEAPTWGTAYRMNDGSVWVKEPDGYTGFHWHTEFPVEGWTWVANQPKN